MTYYLIVTVSARERERERSNLFNEITKQNNKKDTINKENNRPFMIASIYLLLFLHYCNLEGRLRSNR